MTPEACKDIESAGICDDEFACAIVTVISISDQTAYVESSGAGSCSRCAVSKGCGTKSLLAFFGTKPTTLRIENNLGAKVGDQIEIGIEHSKVLKLSALSYLLPLIGLFAGGAISAIADVSDAVAFGLGLAGLAVGFAYSRYLYTSERWEREIVPVCIRLVSSGDEQYVELGSLG